MLAKQLQGAAKSAVPQYIEDVFSTWLYTGNSSTQTITNGIDLSGKGGLVWIKDRTNLADHRLIDTVTGAQKELISNQTTAQVARTTGLTAFNNNGFSLGAASGYNTSATNYVSWTFREQEKFFDVVTYTGNGANRTIAHNLGSVPGCIIVKRTDVAADWQVYHRSLANTEYMVLNTTAAKATGATRWNSTTPTSTVFSLGTDTTVNANAGTYVAYLFAHDAGGFGPNNTDNVISCGSFTTDGSGNATINLGYEPQWLLVKRSDSATGGNWAVIDNMVGLNAATGAKTGLIPNLSNAEGGTFDIRVTSTGFTANVLSLSATYIYVAIRRGPMRTPTSGTSVFSPVLGAGTTPGFSSSFTVDSAWIGFRTGNAAYPNLSSRLTGPAYIVSPSTSAETGSQTAWKYDFQTGFGTNVFTSGYISWLFRRAPGFFDVVCYSGDSTFGRQVTHNLGVTPEMFIVKARNAAQDWVVYHKDAGATNKIVLNTTAARVASTMFNNTAPSATAFVVGASGNLGEVNFSTYNYVAYLFATVTGVSKVGSYTGNGASQTVACGFTAGARFILIKRIDPGSTGDWYVWDTARGIVSGNDPRISMNSTAAEVTTDDTVDPDNSGFIVNQVAATNVNVNNATYIFLAIA